VDPPDTNEMNNTGADGVCKTWSVQAAYAPRERAIIKKQPNMLYTHGVVYT
jgi:hypothetical protein